jgi:hypothetical protein
MIPKMTAIKSSHVAEIGYDENRQLLYVKFARNTMYVYRDVPVEVYRELMKSSSKGIYLDEFVKTNYRFKKVKLKGIVEE